jgi:hypothetical protein
MKVVRFGSYSISCNGCRDLFFIPFEIDDTVGFLMATTYVTHSPSSLEVTATRTVLILKMTFQVHWL